MTGNDLIDPGSFWRMPSGVCQRLRQRHIHGHELSIRYNEEGRYTDNRENNVRLIEDKALVKR
jgi:hypothetical protein